MPANSEVTVAVSYDIREALYDKDNPPKDMKDGEGVCQESSGRCFRMPQFVPFVYDPKVTYIPFWFFNYDFNCFFFDNFVFIGWCWNWRVGLRGFECKRSIRFEWKTFARHRSSTASRSRNKYNIDCKSKFHFFKKIVKKIF